MEEPILFNENICRVCLEEKGIFYWNEEIVEFSGISYKDCYYKYIGSEANDQFPQRLCELCSNGFKNAYLLFEKALESLTLLQTALIMKENKSHPFSISKEEAELQISSSSDCDYKTYTLGVEISIDNDMNDVEEVECSTRVDDSERLLQIENSSDIEEEILTSKKSENEHFVKMKISEFPANDILGQKNKLSSKHGRRKNYLCAYCSLIVSNKTSLADHEATHNKNRERKFTCSKCGIKLYTKLALKNHMEIHQENREKRFKCEFCDKAFFNRGACNVHRRIHLGLMVACPICSKEFYRQVDLDRHLPKHSTARLQKNVEQLRHTVQCEYCNKDVATTKWKEHKAVHLNQPVMKCTICEKDFFSRHKCVQHLHRLHRKTRDEYDDFIYSYVDWSKRLSHLMIKQQNVVRSIPKN